ncbi:hypothetical protein [Mongoliitalea lutea]|uniref:Outer membrane protein beta-barrel domain-containing protein n=1 Tax=Mongoliitalea lutea TaxID=849756 RepID=A0A8J3CWH6_9BACT|nr:hypothetical protein [Mongoliitalea lutea]GHB27212.1 hypothetical protein GCM10008106_04930 [Mongoliitalea lutea]
MRILIPYIFLLIASQVSAQSDEKQIKKTSQVSLEGMLGISVGNDFYAVNVGGPLLFLVVNENVKFGVGALPSIYLLNGKLGARLGVSPRIDFKNIALIAPFYHRDTTGEWIWSVGMG